MNNIIDVLGLHCKIREAQIRIYQNREVEAISLLEDCIELIKDLEEVV